MKPIRLPVPALLLLLFVAAAWPWPVPRPWATGLLPGLAVVGLIAARRMPLRTWTGGVFILGLIALYALNPTHRWSPGVGLLPVAHLRWLPGSADPQGTWQTLGLAAATGAAFALAFRMPARQIRWLQGFALVAGVGMALGVLFQRLGPDPTRIREYTGIFVNENHFAVFSNLLLPVVLVMASRARFRAVQAGQPSSPAGLYLLAAFLMAAAVVVCRSRAGVAVLALLVAAHVGLGRRTIRDYPFVGIPVSAWLRGLGWLSIAAAAGFAVQAFGREWHKLATIGQEWTFRSGILKDALAAWREQPIWGTGPGTFTTVFPYYQSELFAGKTILHAHSEPVQFLMEFGVAGALVVAVAAILLLSARGADGAPSEEIPPFADLERRAFGCGLLACALHCLIDFPLRIPLIALITAAWAGLWTATRPIPAAGSPAPKE
jgi:O-antigen ligase